MSTPSTIGELSPGSMIKFGDITELASFEDAVAAEVDPIMSGKELEAWSGRVPLTEHLRPQKFFGRIGDIALVTMENPYDRLYDARDRGIRFTKSGGMPGVCSGDVREVQEPFYRGFLFTASASSSGRGVVGQIEAELWYMPIGRSWQNPAHERRAGKKSEIYAGMSVHRVVSKPVIKSENAFAELHNTSTTIAYEVLRENLRKPIPQPFRN